MSKTINYYWRVVTTGFCFALFGFGGVVLTLLFFPLQKLCIRNVEARQKQGRKVVHYAFKFFVFVMNTLGVIGFTVKDKAKFANLQGQLVLANHPSLIDVVVMISVIPNADCVVKAHLFKNPFMRGVITNTGYISNADPQGLLADCERSLAQGNNLIIFPEGTRTKPNEPLLFKRGAANIALRCSAPVVGALITMEPSTLTKGTPWYQVAPTKAQFCLQMATEQPNTWHSDENHSLTSQVREFTRYLQTYFTKELHKV